MQVHPVVNLVHDFDPQANLPLGHLALFNVRSALRAASHANLPPVPPSSIPEHNWSTLTFPSPITSDDGRGGRSYPVERGIPPPGASPLPQDDHAAPEMPPLETPPVVLPPCSRTALPAFSFG